MVSFKKHVSARWRIWMRLWGYFSGKTFIKEFLDKLSAELGSNIYVVQIGANDGKRDDNFSEYISRFKWAGIMIEPQPAIFKKLVENYAGNSKLKFENVAISNEEGKKDFYFIDNDEAWVTLVSSLEPNKGMVNDPKYKNKVKSTTVECVKFNAIMKKYGSPQVDLLIIDTEGHEYPILNDIDFNLTRPKAIYFEHTNITYKEHFELLDKLQQLGYSNYLEKNNTLCVSE
jgi:FkbM family methyltransferase